MEALGIPAYYLESVCALTKQRSEKYVDYIERVKKNAVARIVKQYDILDNMQGAPSEEKRCLYINALNHLRYE